MMRATLGAWALGAATLACSGRYYRVGDMDQAGGGGSGHISSANGGVSGSIATAGATTTMPTDGGAEGDPSMPADEFGAQCVPLGAPASLTGAFAKPDVVWSRVAMLIWGKPAPAPTALPTATTYAWAAEVVTQGFAQVNDVLGGAIGARLFVAQYLNLGLDLGIDPKFQLKWETVLGSETPALPALLLAPLGDKGRIGVFTEPTWLAKHTTITNRGSDTSRALFQRSILSPPPGISMMVDMMVDPNLPERVSLDLSVGSQPFCASCHNLADPFGYPLGNFDADGAYRELDHGQQIDVSGHIGTLASPIDYDGLTDFGTKLSATCEATVGLADTFLRSALVMNQIPDDQREALFNTNQMRLRQAFVRSGRSYPDLVRAYAQSELGLRP